MKRRFTRKKLKTSYAQTNNSSLKYFKTRTNFHMIVIDYFILIRIISFKDMQIKLIHIYNHYKYT